ncbi:phage terminase large subunit [Mesorhizobium sp. M8A.F.Ca.ET.021.01.1.1]|uniref:phage terminase large subunit n=1 Tax=Mesorhizobium sp. M8A.F.Ca.ET.021.01.1.1 TaxID=2496757 RepID=UPI00167AD8B9|nr:phage terminase large subunit [Mesorhizobium sp. M8A.F.Ca.ET.021.01.1.1]
MPKPYPYQDRDKAYAFLKQVGDLSTLMEKIAAGQADHSPELQAAIAHMTGATDLHRQHQAIQTLLKRGRSQHESRLIEAAPIDFTAFVEVISPDEPASSKLHRYLGEKLMTMEETPGVRIGVSMPPGHAKDMCVTTPVTMADGSEKPLGEVDTGDFVIGHSGLPREVLEIHNQGKRPVMLVRTVSGRVLYPHAEHPFLTPGGWVQAQHLKAGDVLAQQREFGIRNHSGRTLDEFILAGYMMAAGMIRGRVYSRIMTIDRHFRTDDPEIMQDMIDTAKRLGFRAKISKKVSYGEAIQTCKLEQKFAHWLKTNGMLGEHRHSMRIPAWVFKGSITEIGGFMGAIFAMDATLAPSRHAQSNGLNKMVIRVRNGAIVADLQRLLARLGARSALDKHLVGNWNYEPTTFWSLSIPDAEDQFYLQKTLRIRGVNQRLWQAPIVPRQFFDGRYAADKIVEIIPDWDVRETKCLTVEEDHSFLASGIVVHNSTYCSRLFPAWWMGKRENKKWLQGGHTQRFAEKEFGKKLRDQILTKPGYQKVFPNVGIRSASQDEIVLTNDCSYVVKGVGQGISGYRSHFNNIDDPYATFADAYSPTIREKVWDWFRNDFRSRRLPGAGELIIVTRWHTDDIVGRLEELMKEEGSTAEPWEFINLPAFAVNEDDVLSRNVGDELWPELFTKRFLLDVKATMTDEMWASLYQCNPVLEKGNILQREWLSYYKHLPQKAAILSRETPAQAAQRVAAQVRDPRLIKVDPPESMGPQKSTGTLEILGDPKNPRAGISISKDGNPVYALRTVVSVDTAETVSTRADRSAIQVWILGSDHRHYLAYAKAAKFEFPALVEAIELIATNWGADVILIETKGAGHQYEQARRGLAPCPIIGFNPGRMEKSMRFDGTMVQWQSGNVVVPERADWLADYIDELLKFPSGRYDDNVDASSQYLHWAHTDGGYRRGTKKLKG